jgi:hypothetical protein
MNWSILFRGLGMSNNHTEKGAEEEQFGLSQKN